MFMMTMGIGMVMGFPDLCLTPLPPAPPIPIPYPNISISAMTPDAVKTVLCSCTPVVNKKASISLSNGDQPGVVGGVMSKTIMGSTNWVLGSVKTFVGGSPAQRLCSVTNINCMGSTSNGVGVAIVPSQPRVLVLT